MTSERRHGYDPDYSGPERRHLRVSAERQMAGLAAAVGKLEDRLSDAGARMDNMQQELGRNSQVTDEVREILAASRSGLKALGALGTLATWLTKIGVAVGVVWGLWVALKSGKPPGG